MTYALINCAEISGVIHEVSSEVFDVAYPLTWVKCTEDITCNHLYLNSEFISPAPNPSLAPYNPSVSPRQIRQALTRVGLRESIESLISGGSQDLKDWWEFSTVFKRLHPEVIQMGQALGKTSEEVDAVFQLAESL